MVDVTTYTPTAKPGRAIYTSEVLSTITSGNTIAVEGLTASSDVFQVQVLFYSDAAGTTLMSDSNLPTAGVIDVTAKAGGGQFWESMPPGQDQITCSAPETLNVSGEIVGVKATISTGISGGSPAVASIRLRVARLTE